MQILFRCLLGETLGMLVKTSSHSSAQIDICLLDCQWLIDRAFCLVCLICFSFYIFFTFSCPQATPNIPRVFGDWLWFVTSSCPILLSLSVLNDDLRQRCHSLLDYQTTVTLVELCPPSKWEKKMQIFHFLNIQLHAIYYLLSVAQSVFQMWNYLVFKATLKTWQGWQGNDKTHWHTYRKLELGAWTWPDGDLHTVHPT